MVKICLKIGTAVLFFTISSVSAQTINEGELTVLQGTDFSTLSDFDNKTMGDFINDGQLIVYSNFNNDGLVTFSPAKTTGLTCFKGSAHAQVISGTEISEFNNVRFESNAVQPAFLLSGIITVYGTSDFYKGIVSNSNLGGTFVFEEDATHDNTNDDSYVEGYVQRKGNNEFQFPVGDGGYFRPLGINKTDTSGNLFKSKYIFENSDSLHSHTQKDDLITLINNTEYWEFESNQSAIDAALTLTWNDGTTPYELTREDADASLAIVRWDDAEEKWKLYTSAVDAQNQTVTAAVEKAGIFTLAKIRKANFDDDIVIYNALSPNGDGLNDYFNITGLEKFAENSLEIYNRYGVKVFEAADYGTNENWFRGISQGRVTLNKGDGLPTGTYFYVLKVKSLNGTYKEKAGYLYINSN
jgi:gliding motility-associated-like protein